MNMPYMNSLYIIHHHQGKPVKEAVHPVEVVVVVVVNEDVHLQVNKVVHAPDP